MTQEKELQVLREENRPLKALVVELPLLKEQLAQAALHIKGRGRLLEQRQPHEQ